MLGRLTRFVLVLAFVIVAAALVLSVPVSAGGWVVITLDTLPENIVAGESYSVGMMARQHGQTAWKAEAMQIQAEHVESGLQVAFTALPDETPGHYTAQLLFPAAGEWEWSVGAGMFPSDQPMPVLMVAESTALAAQDSGEGALLEVTTLTLLLGTAAVLAFVFGLFMIARAQNRGAPVLFGVGMLILCAGLAFATYSSVNAQARLVVPATGAPVAVVKDPSAAGQQLFLAKGCVVCHTNDRAIEGSAQYGVNMGPDLTNYKNDARYIHTVLKDPRAVNKAAQMPQLDLKVGEIEALAAFINDHE